MLITDTLWCGGELQTVTAHSRALFCRTLKITEYFWCSQATQDSVVKVIVLKKYLVGIQIPTFLDQSPANNPLGYSLNILALSLLMLKMASKG